MPHNFPSQNQARIIRPDYTETAVDCWTSLCGMNDIIIKRLITRNKRYDNYTIYITYRKCSRYPGYVMGGNGVVPLHLLNLGRRKTLDVTRRVLFCIISNWLFRVSDRNIGGGVVTCVRAGGEYECGNDSGAPAAAPTLWWWWDSINSSSTSL